MLLRALARELEDQVARELAVRGGGELTRLSSVVVVAAVLVKVPAAHTALTVVHAAPLSSLEYVVPATQAAHALCPASAWAATRRSAVEADRKSVV